MSIITEVWDLINTKVTEQLPAGITATRSYNALPVLEELPNTLTCLTVLEQVESGLIGSTKNYTNQYSMVFSVYLIKPLASTETTTTDMDALTTTALNLSDALQFTTQTTTTSGCKTVFSATDFASNGQVFDPEFLMTTNTFVSVLIIEAKAYK